MTKAWLDYFSIASQSVIYNEATLFDEAEGPSCKKKTSPEDISYFLHNGHLLANT